MKPEHRLFAVVLAAGASRRFGSTKQLATLDGETLVRRAARVARETCGDRSVLVVGHDAPAVVAAALDECRFLLVNDHYGDGMGTSIALATKALAHAADAIVVLLADQPLVTGRHVSAMLRAWSGDAHDIVATSYGKTAGPPVLFPRATFADLASLSGDLGGKSLLSDTRFSTTLLECDTAEADVDTPADLERFS